MHQGWLTKLSRGGLPNWNRRWFILIGGSLYYSRLATPSSAELSCFCELLDAQRVDLVPSTAALMHAFKIVRAHARARSTSVRAHLPTSMPARRALCVCRWCTLAPAAHGRRKHAALLGTF